MCIVIEKIKEKQTAIDAAIRYNRAHITYKHWECLQNIKGRQTCYLHRRTQLAKPKRRRKQRYSYSAIRTGKGMVIHGTKQGNSHSSVVKRIGKAKRRLSREHGGQKVCKEILYAGWQDRLIYVLNKAFLPCGRRPSTPKKTPFLTLERHLLLSYSLTV